MPLSSPKLNEQKHELLYVARISVEFYADVSLVAIDYTNACVQFMHCIVFVCVVKDG